MRRRLGLAAAPLPVAAVLIAGAAGFATPGYDPVTLTVSRLAAPGMPWALAVDAAIGSMGLACLALALAAGHGRIPLTIAALGFLCAAAIHLDPASPASTAGHRLASGVAVAALTAAAIAMGRPYGRISFALGLAELAMLASAAVLLVTPFTAWGAWERCLLALQVCWMVTVALTIASADDTARAMAAMASNPGS